MNDVILPDVGDSGALTFGTFLSFEFAEHGINGSQLNVASNIHRQKIQRILNDETPLDPETAYWIARKLGHNNARWLLDVQQRFQMEQQMKELKEVENRFAGEASS